MTLHQKILQKFNVQYLGANLFVKFCYRDSDKIVAAIWEVFNGIGVDGVGVNFLFFLRFSVVFAFCLCFCALFFVFVFCLFPFSAYLLRFFFFAFFVFFFVFLLFFFVFLCFSLFFVVFLCFSLFFFSLYSSQEILVFSAHFRAVDVDCLSVFGYGETAKT